jgi:hypothetical protein
MRAAVRHASDTPKRLAHLPAAGGGHILMIGTPESGTRMLEIDDFFGVDAGRVFEDNPNLPST